MALDRMSDRCKRLCGPNDKHCFINHKEQINCIADMVVNKTSAASMLLGLNLQDAASQELKEDLTESITLLTELSNWIQYLQLVPDLQATSSLILSSDLSEKRTEIRYPVPKGLEGRTLLHITDETGTTFKGQLVDFSQSGMGFSIPASLKPDTEVDCTISDRGEEHTARVRAWVKYCIRTNESYTAGIRIEELEGNRRFNFFGTVFGFFTRP